MAVSVPWRLARVALAGYGVTSILLAGLGWWQTVIPPGLAKAGAGFAAILAAGAGLGLVLCATMPARVWPTAAGAALMLVGLAYFAYGLSLVFWAQDTPEIPASRLIRSATWTCAGGLGMAFVAPWIPRRRGVALAALLGAMAVAVMTAAFGLAIVAQTGHGLLGHGQGAVGLWHMGLVLALLSTAGWHLESENGKGRIMFGIPIAVTLHAFALVATLAAGWTRPAPTQWPFVAFVLAVVLLMLVSAAVGAWRLWLDVPLVSPRRVLTQGYPTASKSGPQGGPFRPTTRGPPIVDPMHAPPPVGPQTRRLRCKTCRTDIAWDLVTAPFCWQCGYNR